MPKPPPPVGAQTQAITLDAAQLLKQWNPKPAKALIEAIEQKRGHKLLCLVLNEAPPVPTALTQALLGPLIRLFRSLGKQPKLDLFLRTTGGVAEIPWRIVSLLREFTDHLAVIVPSFAYSGGTHIAIAADELVLTPFSALGSVDPTRNHPMLPLDPKGTGKPISASVQDLKHCIRFIKEQLGDSYESQNLALIVSELFKYINPLALGALEQAYELSRLITRKVLQTRKLQLSDQQIEKIVESLAGQYFSHSFPISRAEVESDLELPVTRPDDDLLERVMALEQHFTDEFKRSVPLPLPQPVGAAPAGSP